MTLLHRRHTAFALLAISLLAVAVPAQSMVSPADRLNYEGSKRTSYPLGRFDARVQQLHADLGTQARTLLGHAYRRDAIATRGQLAAYQVEMSVTVSMCPNPPTSASRTFASNVGSPITVLPRTTINLPATSRPPQAPASRFELRVPWTAPFRYPTGGGTLCLDTMVYGNNGPNGRNANFTAYLDAHELFGDGRVHQPGYRYGQGCAAASGGAAAYANFELRLLPTGMDFDIQARNGVATDPSGPAVSVLLLGFRRATAPWSLQPSCSMLTSLDSFAQLPGVNSSNGSWSGTLRGTVPLPTGVAFHTQIASGHPINGVTLSDASDLLVPLLGPMPIPGARIASGSDRTSPTGAVSFVVPVTEFF